MWERGEANVSVNNRLLCTIRGWRSASVSLPLSDVCRLWFAPDAAAHPRAMWAQSILMLTWPESWKMETRLQAIQRSTITETWSKEGTRGLWDDPHCVIRPSMRLLPEESDSQASQIPGGWALINSIFQRINICFSFWVVKLHLWKYIKWIFRCNLPTVTCLAICMSANMIRSPHWWLEAAGMRQAADGICVLSQCLKVAGSPFISGGNWIKPTSVRSATISPLVMWSAACSRSSVIKT